MQKKYWGKLKGHQKIAILEILFSMLEFAASYNSYTNLRLRMQHVPPERLATCICKLRLYIFMQQHVVEKNLSISLSRFNYKILE